MIPPEAAVGMCPRGRGTAVGSRDHRLPAARAGSNFQIWVVMPTLMLNPPKTYRTLLTTAAPPGSTVPPTLPGQGSEARTVRVSVIGLYWRTSEVAVVAPAAEPPTVTMTLSPPMVRTPPTMLQTCRLGSAAAYTV